MGPRIIGIGQRLAGDDAVGLAVAARLREQAPPGVEILELDDVADLVPLLASNDRVIIVDALVGGARPGEVRVVAPEECAVFPRIVTSHGLGVTTAVALARALYPDRTPAVCFIAISIDPPVRGRAGLSPAISLAVRPAAELALRLAYDGAQPLEQT
jgi:hydrogenase maturation protease